MIILLILFLIVIALLFVMILVVALMSRRCFARPRLTLAQAAVLAQERSAAAAKEARDAMARYLASTRAI